MSNDAVMTFGYNGLVPMNPFISNTKSCFGTPPTRSETFPSDEPLAMLSVAIIVAEGGMLETKDDERRKITPDAAIRMPRMIGTDPVGPPGAPRPMRPAWLKSVEPALSDMKAPRKYVRPVGPPALANEFPASKPVAFVISCACDRFGRLGMLLPAVGSCPPTVNPA